MTKRQARRAVCEALKTGRLVKPACCPCCSSPRVEGHHEDYDKPLEVEWLCSRCHKEKKHKKTHCPKGHEYTPENTLIKKGDALGYQRRRCRICNAEQQKRYWKHYQRKDR